MNVRHVMLAVLAAASFCAAFAACKGSDGAADADAGAGAPPSDATVGSDGSPPDAGPGAVDADASPSADGAPSDASDASDAADGVQSTCTANATEVTCADPQATATCTLMPIACTTGGSPYSGSAAIRLVNSNGGTCAALEAPFPSDGGAAGASCSVSTDCALVCCGCSNPGWLFATGLCVGNHCAAPAVACAWGYAQDPAVCGPP